MTDSPRGRGVRLSDLDRRHVYRIGFVPERRRWEVLGPEVAPASAGPASHDRAGVAGLAQGAARASADAPPRTYAPRHAAAATAEPDTAGSPERPSWASTAPEPRSP